MNTIRVDDLLTALSGWQKDNSGYPSEVRMPNWVSDVSGYMRSGTPITIYGMRVKFDSALQPGEFAFLASLKQRKASQQGQR